jgi:transcriptional regulator with XRE-family HTH domain
MSRLSQAIRTARLKLGLTQKRLGALVQTSDRAVTRWESAQSEPSRNKRRRLVAAIAEINREVAKELSIGLGAAQEPEQAKAVAAAPPALSARDALALALLHAADELDQPPRRVRGALVRYLRRAKSAGLTLEGALAELEAQAGQG